MRILSHFNVKYGHQRKLKLHLSTVVFYQLNLEMLKRRKVWSRQRSVIGEYSSYSLLSVASRAHFVAITKNHLS